MADILLQKLCNEVTFVFKTSGQAKLEAYLSSVPVI